MEDIKKPVNKVSLKPTLSSKQEINTKNSSEKDKKPKKPSKIVEFFKKNKWAQVVGIILISLIVIGAAIGIYFIVTNRNNARERLKMAGNIKREKPATMPRRLDGVIVATKDANKYPVAVMIENLVDVRPQYGLSKAQVIYEALAEGGITRFMAVYGGGESKQIGPVRSARPYYLEWLSEYDALYAHCGGSQDALETISAFKLKDLNEIGGGSQFFWRGEGEAPHNLYTSSELLGRAIRDMKVENVQPKFESWKFKDQKKKEERTADEKFVKINFEGDYNIEYKYDKESNDYLRFNPIGIEHKDAIDGSQLRPKNVIVQHVPQEQVVDDYGRLSQDVTGEGKVEVFRNGEVVEGTWKKPSRTARTKFYDKDGKEISLARGQIWITVLPGDRKVEWN